MQTKFPVQITPFDYNGYLKLGIISVKLIIDIINHLVELIHEVLPHLISDLLAVLDLLSTHFSVLASRLLQELSFARVVHQLEVALIIVLYLSFTGQNIKLLLHVVCDVDLVLDGGPLLLNLLELGQLLVDLDLLLDLQLLLLLYLLIRSAPLGTELH